jgi:hypothetical protein
MSDENIVEVIINVFNNGKKVRVFNNSILDEDTLEMIMEDVGKKLNEEEEV